MNSATSQPMERTTFGLTPNVAAGLCYLPIQGIFILVSIIMLCSSKDRTVRFAAKQSLLQFAFGFLVLIIVIGGAGAPLLALPEHSSARLPALILLGVSLGAVFVWYLGAYIVACAR